MENVTTDANTTTTTNPTTTAKRGRGRPKGSKNKPKFNPDGTPVVKTKKATTKVADSVSYEDLAG